MIQTIEDEWLALRRASIEVRGVLADLLYLIEHSGDMGAVQCGEVIPRMIGLPVAKFDSYMSELAACGVVRISDGLIVSDRLARKQRRSEILTANGRKGGRPPKRRETIAQ